jgi:ribosomal protein S18 acetylase RimI-like enzyme
MNTETTPTSAIHVHPARREDFRPIAALIDEQNKTPATQCLISGEGAESIYQQMVAYDEVCEICFAVATCDDRLAGVLGGEFDQALGRGWLWGPFVPAKDHWQHLAPTLFEELLQILPPTIRRLDSFLHVENQRGRRFYLNHGFRQDCLAHVYLAQRPPQSLVLPDPCPAFARQYTRSLIALHDATFPNTYETGLGMIARIDHDHQIFVCTGEGAVLGYVWATVAPGAEEGTVEFLGVRADARRKGRGRRLLLTALQWLFEVRKVVQVTLSVYDDCTPARSLYESAGLHLKHSGWGYRTDLTGFRELPQTGR